MNQTETDVIIQVKVIIKSIFPKTIRDFNFKHHNTQQGNDSIVFMMYQNCRLCFKLLDEKDNKDHQQDVVEAQVFNKKVKKLSNDGLSRISVLIEYFWEKLNIGHWKDTPECWRYFYSCASLFKLVYLVYSFNHQEEEMHYFLENAVKVCDMGMLLGEPIFDKILSKIASELHKLRMELISQNKVEVNDIQVNEQDEEMFKSYEFPNQNFSQRYITSSLIKPSMETFLQDFLIPQKPLVLKSTIEYWPARQLWSKEYIRKVCGSRLVPVEIGSKYTSEDWTQKLMKMEEFIDQFLTETDAHDAHNNHKTTSTGYLAQHQLFHQIPELMKDIKIPEYCYLSESQDNIDINSWFGPYGTISPLHTDPKNNLLCQIFGYKFVRLFAPSENEFLYPHDSNSLISNTSQLELEDLCIYEKFPLLQNAKYTDILLEPGQVLFIPTKYWHYVTSLTSSFSVSFWFE